MELAQELLKAQQLCYIRIAEHVSPLAVTQSLWIRHCAPTFFDKSNDLLARWPAFVFLP
jgi:hypothetical protein